MKTLNQTIHIILSQLPLDWNHFLQNLSSTQKQIYFHCITKDIIKVYYVALKYGLQPHLQDEVFSFDINSPEQNQNFGKGSKASKIDKYAPTETERLYYNLPFFTKTLELLPKYIHTCWVVLAKKGSTIDNWFVTDSQKKQLQSTVYVLMEDIKNGSVIINEAAYNKKGEYFILHEETNVTAILEGNRAKFFAFQVNKKDLEKIFA